MNVYPQITFYSTDVNQTRHAGRYQGLTSRVQSGFLGKRSGTGAAWRRSRASSDVWWITWSHHARQ